VWVNRGTNAKDIAVGLVVSSVRAGAAAGRVALGPARVLSRAPGINSAVRRTSDKLAAEGSEAIADGRRGLEAAAGDVLAAPELERTVDRALAGSLPDAVARSLAEHRVVERVVAEVVASPEFEEAVQAALEHELTRRLADRAIASSLSAEVTDRVLDSSELQRVVEHVASSPEVRVAMTRQTASLADELVSGLRRRSERVDDAAQRRTRGWIGRPAAAPLGSYAGLAARTIAFGLDLMLALALFLTGAALAGLAASLVDGLRPQWLVGALLGVWWTLVVGGYFVLFWAAAGQTPAMRVMRMRVTNESEEPPSFGRAVLRFVGLLLAIVPMFAGFLPMLFDARRRGLHDYLGGTVVLYTDRPTPREAATYRASRVTHDAAKPDPAG
jgi:uncharacterized RDD family membrane protein YckC